MVQDEEEINKKRKVKKHSGSSSSTTLIGNIKSSRNETGKREGKYLDYGVDFISQSRWRHAVNDIEI